MGVSQKDHIGVALVCPACGSSCVNSALCPVCGKTISEGFQPLDVIRSSYRLQRRSLDHTPSVTVLFEEDRDLAADAAWACVVYSMVPYLGILFTPLAICLGAFRFVQTERAAGSARRRVALLSTGLGLLILAVQILLWWLLYLIPELQR